MDDQKKTYTDMDPEPGIAFQGNVETMRLISRRRNAAADQITGEVEQDLTISAGGNVQISAYGLGEKGQADRILSVRKTAVEKHMAALILLAAAGLFGGKDQQLRSSEEGFWELELTNTMGQRFHYCGVLGDRLQYQGADLSDMIRNGLDMEKLFVFDGSGEPSRVESVIVDYRRVLQVDGGENEACTLWEYTEQVKVDRKSETILLTQDLGSRCRVTHSYQVGGGIPAMLDSLDPGTLFTEFPAQTADLVALPNESRGYRITVRSSGGPDRVITGSYDSCGLPKDFGVFADKIVDVIRFYGVCEMLAPEVYGLKRRRRSDYIFCSVKFPGSQQQYYYLADEDIYRVGDQVLVPAGKDDAVHTVTIVEIRYFSEEEVPMPLHKVKHILGKKETREENE